MDDITGRIPHIATRRPNSHRDWDLTVKPAQQSLCLKCAKGYKSRQNGMDIPARKTRTSVPDCDICYMLYHAYDWERAVLLEHERETPEDLRRSTPPKLKLFCHPSLPCPFDYFPTHEDWIPRVGEASALERIYSWIRTCNDTHVCNTFDQPSPLPTRILKVETAEGCRRVRLVSSVGQMGRYMCLSHCWGGGVQPIRTTKDTMDTLVSDGLDCLEMPQTFQDAICLTERLGVRYIWIDSLCIVQDDPDDWARESASMADIYTNSYLTIAATSASDASKGFLQECISRNQLPWFSVSGVTPSGHPYRLFASRQDQFRPHPVAGLKQKLEMEEEWPLLTRGWVFQERLLAPRVVHMTREELLWECKELTSCECGNESRDIFDMTKKLTVLHVRDSPRELVRKWQDVVEEYSELTLSIPSDKLPAISGIAKRMAALRNGARYIAGLWDDSLATDLLWASKHWGDKYDQAARRGAPIIRGRAPSWSWACRDIPVTFPLRTNYNLPAANYWRGSDCHAWFSIVDIQCEPATVDRTGSIHPVASLTVRGLVIGGKLNVPDGAQSSYSVELGTGKHWRKVFSSSYFNIHIDDPKNPFGCTSTDEDASNNTRVLFLGLAIFQRHILPVLSGKAKQLEYIMVLRPVVEAAAIYERIGMLIDIEMLIDESDDLPQRDGMPSLFDGQGEERELKIV